MDRSPDNIRDWLNANLDSLITIKKYEDSDQDTAELNLKDVDLVHQQGNDNYISTHALLLNGAGTVITDLGKIPLPNNVYEISLTDKWSVNTEGNTMYLYTERGTYTIEIENSSNPS